MSFLPSLSSLALASRSLRPMPSTSTPAQYLGARMFTSTSLRGRAPVPSLPRSPGGYAAPTSAGHAHSGSGKKTSPHLVWYREIVPAMIPILLLSTTIFLSLSLLRTHLSHARSLEESSARINELEVELDRLRRQQRRVIEKERRERERILPIVVEKVLQRVGAMQGSEEEEELKEAQLLV